MEISVPVTLPVVGYTSLEVPHKIQAIWCLGFAWTGKNSWFPPTVDAGRGMGGGDLCFCKNKIQQFVAILSRSRLIVGCLHRLWVQGMREDPGVNHKPSLVGSNIEEGGLLV